MAIFTYPRWASRRPRDRPFPPSSLPGESEIAPSQLEGSLEWCQRSSVSCTSRCRCQICCNYTPVAALLGGLCRPSSGGKASGHGCSPSRPRSLPALTSWCCSAFQERNFWIGEIIIDIAQLTFYSASQVLINSYRSRKTYL